MKKLNNTEADLKKDVAYIKKRVYKLNFNESNVQTGWHASLGLREWGCW